MLSAVALPPSSIGCLTGDANPISWLLLKFYALKVILDTKWVRSWVLVIVIILTHWVSQPGCLHSSTSVDELSKITPHRHPFSASLRGTLLRFDRPDSSGISMSIAAGASSQCLLLYVEFVTHTMALEQCSCLQPNTLLVRRKWVC